MKPRRGPASRPLTWEQKWELLIGPNLRIPAPFANDDERRAAWEEHREELKASINPGTTSWAEDWYDLGGEHREPEIIDLDAVGPSAPRYAP